MPRFEYRPLSFALGLLLLAGAAAADGDHHESMAGGASGFAPDVVANIEATGEKLLSLAEATPADQFGWAPTDEVRTISEVYIHIVGANLLIPPALGAAPPEGLEMGENPFAMMAEWEASITSKDEVIAKLRESLEYVASVVPTIEDLDAKVELFGPPMSKRAAILLVMSHNHEHLGQSIAYARSLGIVPPWSRSAEPEPSE